MNQKIHQNNTGKIYGNLFNAYTKKQFEDSVELFYTRHRLWDISLDWFSGKDCLDAGCGGGRFVIALSHLNANNVEGIDISENAIKIAKQRIQERNIKNANVQVASVLELPFKDDSFDYVISSGVIHHTHNPHKAFTEIVRVIRPGGKIFLSVYGKGGIKWMVNDLFRYSVCKIISFSIIEKLFKYIGVPANKRYNILDNLYVPYLFRYKEKEIKKWLKDAGFMNLERVKFERYNYKTLQSRIIHGEGWIQIYGDKRTKGK